MQIEVSTGNQLEVRDGFAATVEEQIREALSRFEGRITRASAHFSDENSTAKSGENDKRCSLEVRVGGLQPMAVNNTGETVDLALDGAIDKVLKVLNKTLTKLGDPKGRASMGGESELFVPEEEEAAS